MKLRDRKLAARARKLAKKGLSSVMIATELVRTPDEINALLFEGPAKDQAAKHWLTAAERDVIRTLTRCMVRCYEVGRGYPTIGEVDRAAGWRSGRTSKVIKKRLRRLRTDEASTVADVNRLGFVSYPRDAGGIWLTPEGWAAAELAGFVDEKWRVPE